jgi:hypothetical protein
MAVRRIPPPLKPIPQGDEFARLPVYVNGISEATTGPRDVAAFMGPPSKVANEVPPYPNE